MQKITIALILLLLCCHPTQELKKTHHTKSPKSRLSHHLIFHYPTKESHAPPMPNMVVNVSLVIYSVFGLDENEIMEMNGWAKLTWFDPNLKWDPNKWSNISSIYLKHKRIWIPDVGIANSKDRESKDIASVDDINVELRPDGRALLTGYFNSKTPCPIDLRLFPFDNQTCGLLIGSYFSKQSEFTIHVTKVSKNKQIKSVGPWRFKNYSVAFEYQKDGKNSWDTFQFVRVNIHLQRKALYHIILVLVPYCFISGVAAVMFMLREPGERFAVSLTVILAMTVYLMIVSQGAPQSMEQLSVLAMFVLSQMAFLVILTCFAVIGPMLSRHKREKDDIEAGIEDVSTHLSCKGIWSRLHWSRRYDYNCLIIYVVISFLNGFILLVIVPCVM